MLSLGSGKFVIEKTVSHTGYTEKVTLRLKRGNIEDANISVVKVGYSLRFTTTPLYPKDKNDDSVFLGQFYKDPKIVRVADIKNCLICSNYYKGETIDRWVFVNPNSEVVGAIFKGTHEDAGKYSMQMSNKKWLFAQFFINKHVTDCIFVDGNYTRFAEMWGVMNGGHQRVFDEWVLYDPNGYVYRANDILFMAAFREGMRLLKKMYSSASLPGEARPRNELTTIDDFAFLRNHYGQNDINQLQGILNNMIAAYRKSNKVTKEGM